jgi:oligosaccharide 4-alpha-D-glucosyltransferase
MTMSGVPYVHSDAGGFAGGEGDNELYVRWLQFAAFTPIFRPHGTALYEVEPSAFSFPSEVALINDEYRGYAKKAILQRYEMMPYNYTLAYNQTTAGKPLMSPLYYQFANDTAAANIQDEYMWGDNILVAPILEKGLTEKKYYLPAGKWFDPSSLSITDGGQWYSRKINIWDGALTFFKQGSFTPLNFIDKKAGQAFTNTANAKSDQLKIIYVESDKASSSIMYDDDGSSKASLSTGKYELIRFRSNGRKLNSTDLTVSSNNGTFTGKPLKRKMIFFIVSSQKSPAKSISVNGKSLKPVLTAEAIVPNAFVATSMGLTMVEVEFTGKALNIHVTW